jgi:dTDP-4-amino-4,6-dideoxygalactose transaminase
MIPLCDVQAQYQSLKAEIDEALLGAVAAGRYIMGPNVKALEKEVAAYCGSKHAIGVGNGTDALHLALRGLDIGPGDEVITTPFTFIATAEAVSLVGATPVFVDIDPDTFNIDPKCIEAAISRRTKAIIPVHLYGQPCEMDAIMEIATSHGLEVIEDCAQAIGSAWKGKKVGTFGKAGCFSFFPSKNLGCMGDGGMILTDDDKFYERVEVLRRHGGRVKYHHEEVGMNSRLDDIHAAVLRVKLTHLERWNELRRAHAYYYNKRLADVGIIRCPVELAKSGKRIPTAAGQTDSSFLHAVYHQYTALIDGRDELMNALNADEVGCLVYYPVPLHRQEVYLPLGYEPGRFPHAEAAAERCFSIPMFPELTETQQDAVVASIKKFAASRTKSKAA